MWRQLLGQSGAAEVNVQMDWRALYGSDWRSPEEVFLVHNVLARVPAAVPQRAQSTSLVLSYGLGRHVSAQQVDVYAQKLHMCFPLLLPMMSKDRMPGPVRRLIRSYNEANPVSPTLALHRYIVRI
jgi:hypothetical protein